ncbi:hypothetical protein MMYC01_208630 [Madurella mycetomatis]|uniref:Uncharacterized protein n=1 Tax=Madurella mycetomatis TaxID=100816 RepID=A0A175VXB3_9PEZI|nr:hypothetical protein MMYC01_208630 [Madurella mycetomatis]
MMFKVTTVIAVASALLSSAQAAAVDAKSPLLARQNDVCPQNGESCGFFLLDSAQNAPCSEGIEQELEILTPTDNIYNSIYTIVNGVPTAWVRDCTPSGGCSRSGVNPSRAFCNNE